MQQSICQPEQLGMQQSGNQQMMLCPVRVVYETQILVQPGEQIQPNQTIFINPQNPPPWVQNRPQNQVIYVQQMPQNNMISSIQRPMDQNQMLIQQTFPGNYQQVIQNQMLAQTPHEAYRAAPVQHISNMIHPSMIQNVQANIGQNLHIPNEMVNQNQQQYTIQQAPSQNINNVGHNVIQIAPNNVRPVMPNVQAQTLHQNVNMPNAPKQVNIGQPIGNQVQVQNIQQPVKPQMQTVQQIQVTQLQPNQIQPNQIQSNQMQVNQLQTSQMQTNQIQPQQNLQNYQQMQLQQQNQLINRTAAPQTFGQIRPSQIATPANANMNIRNQPVPIRRQVSITSLPNRVPQVPERSNMSTMTSPSNMVQRNSGQVYCYRQIQPRPPPQVRQSMPNLLPMPTSQGNHVQMQNIRPIVNPNVQNIPNVQNVVNSHNLIPPNHNSNAHNIVMSVKTNEDNNILSRKRKSESPDEIQKKKPVITTPQPVEKPPIQQLNAFTKNIVTSNDIGVNTSPVHKINQVKSNMPGINMMQNQQNKKPEQIKPITNIKTEAPSMPILNIQPLVTPLVQTSVNPKIEVKDAKIEHMQTEEKLVRNTVFTQARGRLLTDKEPVVVVKNETITPLTEKPEVKSELKALLNSKPLKIESIETIATTNVKVEKVVPKLENIRDRVENIPSVSENATAKTDKVIEKPEKSAPKVEKVVAKTEKCVIKCEIPKELPKIENVKTEKIKLETPKKELETVKPKQETAESNNKKADTVSIEEIKGKEIHFVDGNVHKEERDNFILTHVLDGYVIQESNMAFPIRRPLKEKAIYANTRLSEFKQQKLDTNKPKDETIRDNSKILNISHLNLNEEVVAEDVQEVVEEKINEGNPFGSLQPNTVESWSVEDLSTHLSKYNWSETTSVLREHEIDGESLLLVSKQQLIKIGVDESHADIICEFVKS